MFFSSRTYKESLNTYKAFVKSVKRRTCRRQDGGGGFMTARGAAGEEEQEQEQEQEQEEEEATILRVVGFAYGVYHGGRG
jgi:hypothetical protein